MKKEALVYILIFILSFALTSATLFFMTKNKKNVSVPADSLKKEAKKDSTSEDIFKNVKPVEKKKEKTIENNYSDDEKLLMSLVEKIKNIHGIKSEEPLNKEEQDKQWAKVDSTLKALKDEVRIYKKKQDQMAREIGEYKSSLRKKDEVIKNQNARIAEYEKKITTLKSEYEEETRQQKSKESADNLKSVAKIYNNMDPKKAADFIQKMPVNKGLMILKSLNQKKAAKILAAMQPQMAAIYTQKMAE